MTVAPALLREYPAMSDAQRAVVAHGDGPLLVIASPGSGKTFSLVLRAINLLLLNKATPRELVICTFTEKAAFELRDRIAAAARKVGYTGDLSELRVGTIHGLCNRLLSEHRHHTLLGNNYETLDELTQLLFIFEHFDEIIGPETNGQYLRKWNTRWAAIEGARAYFDKITEELVDAERLQDDRTFALQRLGKAYLAYRHALLINNRLDFAHLRKLLHDLLLDPEVAPAMTRGVKYVLVDEYQDTNFIQEQILLKLSATTGNLCVVGDEDQSLYRFRGATVEYEDPEQPFPKGHVQVMTIHQAKGLGFPVVVVGSLDKQLSTSKSIDRDLQSSRGSNPRLPSGAPLGHGEEESTPLGVRDVSRWFNHRLAGS